MELLSLDKETFENNLDKAKTVVLASLVDEGIINKDDADKWCATHTIILKKKTFFRTISKIWGQTKDDDDYNMIAVKLTKDILN